MIATLPVVIDSLQSEGYSFVTADRLLYLPAYRR
jgi:hypothetical protein